MLQKVLCSPVSPLPVVIPKEMIRYICGEGRFKIHIYIWNVSITQEFIFGLCQGFGKNNKAVHHLPVDHSEYITLGMYVFIGLYQKIISAVFNSSGRVSLNLIEKPPVIRRIKVI